MIYVNLTTWGKIGDCDITNCDSQCDIVTSQCDIVSSQCDIVANNQWHCDCCSFCLAPRSAAVTSDEGEERNSKNYTFSLGSSRKESLTFPHFIVRSGNLANFISIFSPFFVLFKKLYCTYFHILYCKTQPPAPIGWVALSSLVCRLFVCLALITFPLMMICDDEIISPWNLSCWVS